MSKRPNLAAALHDAGARPALVQTQPAAIAAAETAQPEPRASAKRPPSRSGQRAVTLYVKPEAHRQLAMMALEQAGPLGRKVTIQDLMTEALNDLFKKHGRSLIA